MCSDALFETFLIVSSSSENLSRHQSSVEVVKDARFAATHRPHVLWKFDGPQGEAGGLVESIPLFCFPSPNSQAAVEPSRFVSQVGYAAPLLHIPEMYNIFPHYDLYKQFFAFVMTRSDGQRL